MKVFLFIALLLQSNFALAEMQDEKIEVPPHLVGATYTVKLKDGTTYEYSSEDMKLVDRKPEPKKVRVKAAAAPRVIETIKEVEVEKPTPVYRPYSIGLYAGIGPARLRLKENAQEAEIEETQDFVAGVSLGYQLNMDWQLRAAALSNETFLLGLDWKFGSEKKY